CAQQRHGRLRDARRTLTEAEPDLHAPSDLATLYGTRSLVEVNLGDPDAAAGFVERAVVVVRETGSPALLAQTLGLRAEIWRVLDRLDDARRGFDEADRMAEEVGALDVRAKVANSRMIVSQMAGDPPEVSLTLVDEALALAERAGNLRLRAGALLHRAGLQHRRQRLDDAEHAAALAEAGYREVGDVGGVTHAQATRGKILVDLGRLEDARAVLEAATEGARALGGGPFVAAVESLRALLAPDPSGSEEGGAADSTVQ
ncbi:MAG: hypothetical protein KC621_13185, partial [Myxococcales bacterium]|nr:hypothetical protein [Myxococcales bacterium]